ncbi:MAG: gliding motility-associated C-terminal domain-containing protein, partial [Bacteroidota bacterium]
KNLTTLLFVSFANYFICQTSHIITISKANEICSKGAAGIKIEGQTIYDTVSTYWSNNQYNVSSIKDLNAGSYFVHIIIKHSVDTTLNFKIEKEVCKVLIANHFTPNGDNYNDYLQISNIQNYPKFELFIYNKWGQQVHCQKETYTPWNGTWNGINVLDETYYYIFYYDSGDKHNILKGDITIIR